MRRISRFFVVLTALCCAQVGAAQGLSPAEFKDAYDRATALETTAPAEAFAAMERLAEAGHSKAQDRVGYYLRSGIGRDVDLQAARGWYRRAVAGGRDFSLAPLARVEIALGNGAAALDLLQRAHQLDMPGATRQLALAHVDGQFGALSHPQRGLSLADPLVAKGDAKTAIPFLLRYNWRRLPDPAPASLVQLVEATGLAGDARAAEAALWYLTRVEPEAVARRAALLAVPGQRPNRYRAEQIALARDVMPETFWLEAERILHLSEPEAYARAAVATFRINKNAYYRVLQMELAGLGYPVGRADGLLGPATITAINRFCRDRNIVAACATGPARTATVRAVSDQLARLRSE